VALSLYLSQIIGVGSDVTAPILSLKGIVPRLVTIPLRGVYSPAHGKQALAVLGHFVVRLIGAKPTMPSMFPLPAGGPHGGQVIVLAYSGQNCLIEGISPSMR